MHAMNGSSWRGWAHLAAVAALTLVARSSLADHYHVPSGSMRPTLQEGDHLVADKRAYGLRLPFTTRYLVHGADPQPGDVVVLASPEDGETLVKRVAAVAGPPVAGREGFVVVDGRPAPIRADGELLREQLGAREHALTFADGGGPDFGPLRVPRDHVLLLGDNRGNSRDGRTFGWVRRDRILGRVVAVFYRSEAGLTWLRP